MKIGILTWFYGSNYGAKAQSYALNQTIKGLGHEVIMVNYRTQGYEALNKKMNLNYPNIKWHPIRKFFCLKRNEMFIDAMCLYRLSSPVSNSQEINDLSLDVIVFGSDAIFNVKHPLFDDVYMGVGITTNKIAYSPSCEDLDPNHLLSTEQITSIKEFKCIAVRDVNTKALLKNNCNLDVKITLDPTLLYDFTEINAEWNYRNYLLVYSFSDWNQYRKELRTFAKARGLKILSVGRYCDWADINIDAASFEQWVTSFKYAEYVFTDSFHGTAFAIKNKKELILVSRDDKRAKIQSLLNDVGINKIFYRGGDVKEYLECYVSDYNTATEKLSILKNSSIEYLRDALQRVESK